MTDYDNQLAHLIKLAKTPGWKQYAWQRALELDRDNTGLWLGIAEALRLVMVAHNAALAG